MAVITTVNLPPALRTITEKLNFQTRNPCRVGRFETYKVDLSEWSLSLPDTTPCIWVQASDLETLSPPELADSLKDVANKCGWQNSIVLVFVDGQVETLRSHLPAALPTYVILNAEQQTRVQKADSPARVMLDILLSQMPRSQLAPYETHKPVIGSQFFGRQSEINKVLQHPQKSYLFMGIRRIGKTSLLKELQRRMDCLDPPHDHQIRRLYIDCTVINSEEDFLRTLTYQLARDELKLLMGRASKSKRYQSMMFDRFASLHGGPVTFLIDELDRLLPQANNDWHLFDVLRATANESKARFIMAGFRQAMEAARNQHTPYFNWAEPIQLGRLQRSDVKYMVLVPMERLRINIQNPEGVVNRINRETAGLPNYVQFYCKTLLERLDEEERDILIEDDLQAIYESREFRDFVLDTFMSNSEPLERALVYALVAEDHNPAERRTFSQRTMDSFLKRRKLSLTLEKLDHICRNLEVAGVFNQIGSDFAFAIPLFQQMLRQTRDVEFLFDKTREEILAAKTLL